jgi:Right handed beta helix region/Malectin domain
MLKKQTVGASRSARVRRILWVTAAALIAVGVAIPLTHSSSANATGSATIAGVVTPPPTIDRTGSTDVTAAMQAWLTKVPHHSMISFPSGAKYRAEGTLAIRRKNDIVVQGNGATFFATVASSVRDQAQWVLENDSNIVFSNLAIRGTHTNGGQDDDAYVAAREAQHGVLVQGGERIELRNLSISDVYGDFIYVGKSPGPIYGDPENVWIHDNFMRRNGRQGVSVTDATGVVVERNNIADTRRATIDFEPLENWVVDNIAVRNNQIGPGRLMFVAAHGEGLVNDITITNNTLTGHSLGIDLAAETGDRRRNVVVQGNTSDTPEANPRGALMRFVRYDYVDVRNNVNPTPATRQMSTVGTYDSCKVTSVNNDLGAGMVGEIVVLSNNYDCSTVPSAAPATATRTVFADQRLVIDTGGIGSRTWGIVGCTSMANCGGYLVAGPVRSLFTPTLVGFTGWEGVVYQTMLEGDPKFEIPIRTGTYDVKFSFVEPKYDRDSQRRFFVDMERQRALNGFDVYNAANGMNKLTERTFRVTVGDGTLDIDFSGVDAIVSLITITRA